MNNHANSNVYARRGLMLVLSSPSGAGKTTLAKALLAREENLRMSISFTTRLRRAKEVDGEDYNFVNETKFKKMAEAGEFLEYAQVFGNYYGTPRIPIEKALASGSDILFDIDWQGTQQLKKNKDLSFITFFILPPNVQVLKERLLNRHNGQEEIIEKRMNKFNEELSHWTEYSYVVINDDLDICYNKILDIIMSEKKGITQRQNTNEIVKKINELIK